LFYNSAKQEKKEKIAVVLGTYRYKALEDSYAVFEMLRAKDDQLKLMIIGDDKKVPKSLRTNPNIILMGSLPRDKVVDYLRQSEFYISTTYIENSYNAASEGIFFAKESYISDIAPHRELVTGLHFEEVSIPNLNRSLLHLKREEISPVNLKTWDNVITEMVEHISESSTRVC
jgi:glycosyltransferase involved in cell wall biosynthesis